MTACESAIAEIDAALARHASPHRGLREYAKIVKDNHSLEDVNAEIAIYDRRVNALVNAKNMLLALMADGYPDLPVRSVDQGVMTELLNDASDLEAAKALFASNAAREMTLTGGKVAAKA